MTKNISVRLTENHIAALQGAAAIKGISISALVEELIKKEKKENEN